HTHTTNSDGDVSPRDAVAWYAGHGYHFLALTDHNYLTPPGALAEAAAGMLLIPAEEITPEIQGHVNGFGIHSVILPPPVPFALALPQQQASLIDWAIGQVEAQGGLAQVNHPNGFWGLSYDVLRQVSKLRLFEVFNAHPT